jgi:hypothetical protein
LSRTAASSRLEANWRTPNEQYDVVGRGAHDENLAGVSRFATANPYGITLDRVWTDWAAQHGASETIAVALCLNAGAADPEDGNETSLAAATQIRKCAAAMVRTPNRIA